MEKRPARGRPQTYDPERHPLWAEGLAKLGKIEDDIAAAMGIHVSTLRDWKKKFPEFSVALKIGKSEADTQVESALYKRALGYQYEEIKTVNGDERIEKTIKQVPPDVTAQIFWLKNRRPDEWRDKQQTEITGKDGGPIRVVKAEDLSDDELASIIATGSRK